MAAEMVLAQMVREVSENRQVGGDAPGGVQTRQLSVPGLRISA